MDIVTDFEGANAEGGDQIALLNDSFLVLSRSRSAINPISGAALGGAGNGVTDVVYTVRNGNTFLIADTNDYGVLDSSDTVIKFTGDLDFTVSRFHQLDRFHHRQHRRRRCHRRDRG